MRPLPKAATMREIMKAKATHFPSERRFYRPARARAGRPSRLGGHAELVLGHRDIVFNLAYRVLGDAYLAASTTEDAFQRALSARSQSRQAAPKLWLLRIAVTLWQPHLFPVAEPAPSPRDTCTGGRLVESTATSRDCRPSSDHVQALFNSLPPDERITLVLSDVGGLSYREIAEVTGSSVDLIRSRLSRGRAALRDHLLAQGALPAPAPT